MSLTLLAKLMPEQFCRLPTPPHSVGTPAEVDRVGGVPELKACRLRGPSVEGCVGSREPGGH